ncbi:rhodanese-like domain-containing protein [Mobilitalea sibirica]|uniref:Rhodanese-like domain-containing protein n=1 Tax=Mobilitalea sibirica TaxID=1462919 RepID=A0A8J7HBE6_9FIRM|nr:rhodanese-like domain-containing protein [Mobilitalea sibirica]MBH1941765.1 rhodanese-like domain-containing protein [Mobilitalea sibirica]
MFSIFKKEAVDSIHASEIDQMYNDINLVDIREPYECASSRIKKARNIPMGQLLANPDKYLNKDQKYYIICQSGARSHSTTSALLKSGYDVVNVKGGMGSYTGENKA